MLSDQYESINYPRRSEWKSDRHRSLLNYEKIHRILKSRVGHRWDDVYSYLIKITPQKFRRTLDHYLSYLVESNIIIEDKEIFNSRGTKLRWIKFYVKSGILCEANKQEKFRRQPKKTDRLIHTSSANFKYYRDWDGQWWWLKLQPISSRWDGRCRLLSPIYPIFVTPYCFASDFKKRQYENKLVEIFGTKHFAWMKHKISPKTATKLGLTEFS